MQLQASLEEGPYVCIDVSKKSKGIFGRLNQCNFNQTPSNFSECDLQHHIPQNFKDNIRATRNARTLLLSFSYSPQASYSRYRLFDLDIPSASYYASRKVV